MTKYRTLALILLNYFTSVVQTEDVQQMIHNRLREMTLSLVQPNESRVEHQQAYVGKLFQYILPKDSEVKVKELPDWLTVDGQAIFGVPSATDKDLQISLYNSTSNQNIKNLTININTVDLYHKMSPKSSNEIDMVQAVRCSPRSSVTRAAVTFDANISKLQPLAKGRMIQSLCSHLGMPEHFVRMLAADDKMPLVDASALVSGLGDVVQPAHPGVVLQWEVGCGNVQAFHMSVLQKVEETAASGNMRSAVGHGVVGWHVTNQRHPRVRRRVRDRSRLRTSKDDEEDSSGFWDNLEIHRADVRQEDDHEGSGFTITPTMSVIISTASTSATTVTPSTAIASTTTIPATTTPTTTTTTGTTPTTTPLSNTTITTVTSPVSTTTTPIMTTTSTTVKRGRTTRRATTPTTASSSTERQTTTTTTSTTPATTPTPKPSTSGPSTVQPSIKVNTKPELVHQIQPMAVMAGDYFQYKIPANTFKDAEDGDVRNLHLMMFTQKGFDITLEPSWLTFDSSKQLMYGIPLPFDMGTYVYYLTAADSKGAFDTCKFEVSVVKPPNRLQPSHEIMVTFDIDYNKFITDRQAQQDLILKVANAYGDSDPSKMTITKVEEGSVRFAWTNTSLPSAPCPADGIRRLISVLLTDNYLNDDFVQALQPYRIVNVEYELSGSCKVSKVTQEPSPSKPEVTPGGAKSSSKKSDSSVFIWTVIPAVIVAGVLIIIAIAICCICKCRRSAKSEKSKMDPVHVRHGAPVIFAEELDDANKPDMSRMPLILDKEKPPQPAPPEYGSQPSSPPSNHRELLGDEDNLLHTPYNRPPPFKGAFSYAPQYTPTTPADYARIKS